MGKKKLKKKELVLVEVKGTSSDNAATLKNLERDAKAQLEAALYVFGLRRGYVLIYHAFCKGK